MDDLESGNFSPPSIAFSDLNKNSNTITKQIEGSHELLAQHGITLISWEYTPPIVNRFE